MNKPLINYYARLCKRGQYKIENVPDDKREAVIAAMKELPDPDFDPTTQTPEANGDDVPEKN